MIHELFYESYIAPSITRNVIFYLLKTQNSCNLKIPLQEFLTGLEVVFYGRKELREILSECGFNVVDYHQDYWTEKTEDIVKLDRTRKLLFLKDWGRMLFILKTT